MFSCSGEKNSGTHRNHGGCILVVVTKWQTKDFRLWELVMVANVTWNFKCDHLLYPVHKKLQILSRRASEIRRIFETLVFHIVLRKISVSVSHQHTLDSSRRCASMR